jgi:hypothetical protein
VDQHILLLQGFTIIMATTPTTTDVLRWLAEDPDARIHSEKGSCVLRWPGSDDLHEMNEYSIRSLENVFRAWQQFSRRQTASASC